MIKKYFILIFVGIFFHLPVNAQTMIPLSDYLKENDRYLNSPATQSYIYNRCAAANLYIGGLIQDKDKETSQRYINNYEKFSNLNISTLMKNQNFSQKEALKNLTENVAIMVDFYKKDGLETKAKTGEYTKNYISEDVMICVEILRK